MEPTQMTTQAPSAGVTIDGLSLAFGETEVLKDIGLVIEPGEFFAFLGPSGSGKSTLLRAIAGFGPTPRGAIRIGGEDVTRLPPWKRNVGMVFQSYALWPHMSVRRNVAFGLEERRLPAARIREKVDAALDLVGLRALADRRPSQLSGGQQQRVALARTIVVEPRALLLDEPLSNLDANLRIHMRREIRELQQRLRLTTIFVTHDQEEANTTADRMAVLDDGVIQQVGTPMDLYDRPANLFVAGFLGTANVIEGHFEEEAGRVVFRSADGIVVPLAKGAEPGAGTRAGSIMFRPQNVSIHAPGPAPRDNPQDGPMDGPGVGVVRVDGRVEHREFLGSLIRYAVRVGAHEVVVDDTHQQGVPAIDLGETVELALDSGNVTALKG